MSIATLIEPGLGSFGNIATLITDGLASHTGLPQPPASGYEYADCTSTSWTGYSLQANQSPAIVSGTVTRFGSIATFVEPGLGSFGTIATLITDGLSTQAYTAGDVFITQQVTNPGNYSITINGDGTVDIFSNGDESRQSFLYDLYRVSTNAITGPGTVWVDEVGPVWSGGLIASVQTGTTFSVNLNTLCISPEGDSLVFTLATGVLPPSFTLNPNGLLTGPVGALAATYNFTFAASDSTLTNSLSPASQVVIFAPAPPPPPPTPGQTQQVYSPLQRVTSRQFSWTEMAIRAWGSEFSAPDHRIYEFSNGRGFDSTDMLPTGIYRPPSEPTGP